MSRLIISCFCLLMSVQVFAQERVTPLQALNHYVTFVNESIHGMVIVHRLLENYNQELNNYVDLEGYQINNFGNKDLPKNIFEDPDRWFYKVSPKDCYTLAMNASKTLTTQEAGELNVSLKKMYQYINRINSIRFDIEKFIQTHDLNDKTNVEKVYSYLEEGTKLYDDFFETQKSMEVVLQHLAKKYERPDKIYLPVIKAFKQNVADAKQLIRAVRMKQDESFEAHLSTFVTSNALIKNIDINSYPASAIRSGRNLHAWKQIGTKFDNIKTKTSSLIQSSSIPKEYKFYGKFYFYHNAVLANQVNRYGNGFVHEMNKLIRSTNMGILYQLEEPHFYQVIYPKKLKKDDDVIESADDKIVAVPKRVKDRTVINSSRVIKADTNVFVIKLYDYKIQDGDIVSINFNGDWILENHSLEGAPTQLKVKLNTEGKNFLILHAENEGRNPPNTMAVSYTYKGKLEKLTLSSNLKESSMIEIKYDPQ